MVIMTFDGTPMGVSRRLGTGGIIFGSRLSSTKIVTLTNNKLKGNIIILWLETPNKFHQSLCKLIFGDYNV